MALEHSILRDLARTNHDVDRAHRPAAGAERGTPIAQKVISHATEPTHVGSVLLGM